METFSVGDIAYVPNDWEKVWDQAFEKVLFF